MLAWYNYDNARLFTFVGWAQDVAMTLSSAGFFYMGVPGHVVCCACDATLPVNPHKPQHLTFTHRTGSSGCASYRFRLASPSGPIPVTLGLRRGVSLDVRRALYVAELQDSTAKRLATFPERDDVTTYMADHGFINSPEQRIVTCHYCRLELPNFGLQAEKVKELHESFSPFCKYSTLHDGDSRLRRVYQHLEHDSLFQEKLAEIKHTFDQVDTLASLDDIVASLCDA